MLLAFASFVGFTALVAFFSWYKLRKDALDSSEGYFLGGRSLTGVIIAGSMLLTNISTEHLIGLNGSSYKNGMIVIAWEVTSALALVAAALYFVPKYLKLGVTTIPQYLEHRFDRLTRTLIALFLMVSFVVTLLPIVLYTGAINLESLFNVAEVFGVSHTEGLWITVIVVGLIGSVYAIFGGLKAVAYSDTLNGYGLLLGGLLIPLLALWNIGDGNPLRGLEQVYARAPEKFNVIGAKDSVLPFETLFTGLIINQLYFWCMNQTIVQRALGAKNLIEAQKGLLYTGLLKILVPIIIILPGIISFYYFGDAFYDQQDRVYPELVKRVLPTWLYGFFAAVIMGAVLSTFNSVLNSAATIFSCDLYKQHLNQGATEHQQVVAGKLASALMAVFAIAMAPLVADAPEGLYQLLQQLNGIFFIPIASIMLAGFFLPYVSALAARATLFVGLAFYVLTFFVFQVDLHFIHLWGIEFVLNMVVMLSVSYFFPARQRRPEAPWPVGSAWKYAPHMGLALTAITILIYIWLGQ
ncbi:solute:Na+ symporter, SSS family [Catalinimonas alkaloidigena]|uniref:Solute:Na+ symporter, SSS family n=1 Tax=Catalinimonas alkaloidigena TaxID=1075417 RepID=A0A1G8YK13_9BACT|nr:solute:sodium symporter family transporter [Catalinimonas alkaloidigena]SDK02774.1 solute:Na+ symporter, SSS family [Catalinimonas alkaloidigena]